MAVEGHPEGGGYVPRVEFEAELMRQEHRLFNILRNFFSRKRFPTDDPRRQAIIEAVLWRVCIALAPTAIAGGASVVAIVGLIVALHANWLVQEQNSMLKEQTALLKSQDRQLGLQNRLVESQNNLLGLQNELSEASRRSATAFELSSVLDAIATEIRATTSSGKEKPEVGWILSDHLYGRIAALSWAIKPYRFRQYAPPVDGPSVGEAGEFYAYHFADVTLLLDWTPEEVKLATQNQLNPQPLSPERAQLLIALLRSNVSLSRLDEMGAVFDFADLRFTELRGANLSGLRLRNASFILADLSEADLSYADLTGADLRGTRFDQASLDGAILFTATLDHTQFSNTSMRDALFYAKDLRNSVVEWALVTNVERFGHKNEAPRGTYEYIYRVSRKDDGFTLEKAPDEFQVYFEGGKEIVGGVTPRPPLGYFADLPPDESAALPAQSPAPPPETGEPE